MSFGLISEARRPRNNAMTEDPRQPATPVTSAAEQAQIALDDPHQVAAWCRSLACTEVDLRRAVLAIGPNAERVREYLATHA
ncbi:DUF3606 domain-containing protein [Variovorax brevis]|uniref:DUF3606 domain-containing protein n=1 Tax=Variovorax brevis TaxID=3053503 RepID=UPI003365471D